MGGTVRGFKFCFLFLLCFTAPALAKSAGLDFELEPGQAYQIDLAKEAQLKGPFLLVAGPSWVSVNAQGMLLLKPEAADVGTHEVKLEVKSGSAWVELKVELEILYFKYGVKVFTAPWCQTCRDLIPELEDELELQFANRDVNFEVYLETDHDLYEAPTQATANAYRKDLGIDAKVIPDVWKWEEYRKHFPKGFQLPAAVVYREGAKEVQAIGPGHFKVSHVLAALKKVSNVTVGDPVSMLWVVDNSGSMNIHQSMLSQISKGLFQKLANTNAAWEMGMVTTDIQDAPVLPLAGNILDGYAPNPSLKFSQAVQVGVAGSGVEKPFDSVKLHLEGNPEFIQRNADLVVVVVTDEEDQSSLSTQGYLQFLARWVGDIRRVRHVNLIASTDNGCGSTGTPWTYAGGRLDEVTKFTQGKSYRLCKLEKELDSFVQSLVKR